MVTGSCLCGDVKFEIEGELAPIQICHCGQCRKAQGSAFVTNIPIEESKLKYITGTGSLSFFESSPGKQRCFCNKCGSPVYSKTVKIPGVLRIRAGLLDGELSTKPICHFCVSSKANWLDINDDLPQYSEAYVP